MLLCSKVPFPLDDQTLVCGHVSWDRLLQYRLLRKLADDPLLAALWSASSARVHAVERD